MKRIPLTKGLFAFVDDEDYKRLIIFKWRPLIKGDYPVYAISQLYQNQKKKTIYMHRLILGEVFLITRA